MSEIELPKDCVKIKEGENTIKLSFLGLTTKEYQEILKLIPHSLLDDLLDDWRSYNLDHFTMFEIINYVKAHNNPEDLIDADYYWRRT